MGFRFIICRVKTRSFENYTGARAYQSLDGRRALGAFFERFVGHPLECFKPVAAFFAFIFVCRHFISRMILRILP